MGKENYKQVPMLMWVLVAGLLSQNLVFSVMATNSFEEQKNYYSHNPHRSPPSGSHGSHHGTPPKHGSGGGGYGGTPPTHTTPSTPSPGNCETPPTTVPTPSTPSNPPSGGSGTVPTPSTPSNPPSGGGGYYPTPGGTPPTPVIVSPPTTPTPYFPTPPTPTPTPTPYIPTPPTPTPYIPTPPTPTTPDVPSPPFVPDPNSPFTCNYWRNHPTIVWGLLGWWGTLGNAFGVTTLPGFGTSMSVQQALSNTRTDGYGKLYREGTASLLNSMVARGFPFTTRQVRENFIAALGSNKAAAAQGQLFKLANEGRLKPRT